MTRRRGKFVERCINFLVHTCFLLRCHLLFTWRHLKKTSVRTIFQFETMFLHALSQEIPSDVKPRYAFSLFFNISAWEFAYPESEEGLFTMWAHLSLVILLLLVGVFHSTIPLLWKIITKFMRKKVFPLIEYLRTEDKYE